MEGVGERGGGREGKEGDKDKVEDGREGREGIRIRMRRGDREWIGKGEEGEKSG